MLTVFRRLTFISATLLVCGLVTPTAFAAPPFDAVDPYRPSIVFRKYQLRPNGYSLGYEYTAPRFAPVPPIYEYRPLWDYPYYDSYHVVPRYGIDTPPRPYLWSY